MIHVRVSLSLTGTSKEFPGFAGNSQQLHTGKKSNCQKSLVAVTSWTFTLEFPPWNFTAVVLFCLYFKQVGQCWTKLLEFNPFVVFWLWL